MHRSGRRVVLAVLRKAILKVWIILMVALLPAVVSGWIHWQSAERIQAHPSLPEISVSDALLLSKGKHVLWIDARGRRAFDEGHIADAISMPQEDWEGSIPALVRAWEPGQPVVVYCDGIHCDASRSVAARLEHEFGMNNIYTLKGGWDAWLQKGK